MKVAAVDATDSTRGARVESVKVWDPLVRIFHWALVAAFAVAWFSSEESNPIHRWAGYVVAGLVVFRLLWGVVGARNARFESFVRPPREVIAYLLDAVRLKAKRTIGHNPAGAAMIIALLLSLAVITGSGIMMTTDAFWGIRWVRETHEIAVDAALVLVGLHIAGVVLASIEHRENLVAAMFTGRKRAQE